MASRRKRLPVTLSAEEQTLLLAQPNPRYPTGERNRLLVRMMLDTGVRLAEAAALRWPHVDLATGKLMVIAGKGAKDRSLWISAELLARLQAWRERQLNACGHTPEHIFFTLDGRTLLHRYIQAMVQRYSQRAGIAKRVSPHVLRHTFATDLYRQSHNIRLVQKALGHADLSTTMIYTHVYDEEIAQAMQALRASSDDTLHDGS